MVVPHGWHGWQRHYKYDDFKELQEVLLLGKYEWVPDFSQYISAIEVVAVKSFPSDTSEPCRQCD